MNRGSAGYTMLFQLSVRAAVVTVCYPVSCHTATELPSALAYRVHVDLLLSSTIW